MGLQASGVAFEGLAVAGGKGVARSEEGRVVIGVRDCSDSHAGADEQRADGVKRESCGHLLVFPVCTNDTART